MRGQPLPAVGGGGAGHHHLLYPLHRLRLFRLRQAVFHPVRHGLPHGHADLGGGHRDLHRHGRISGRLLHRSDPVHHHDGGPGGGPGLRRDPGGRRGGCPGQRPFPDRLPVPDPHPRPRHRRFRALRPADHLFPVGLGPGILRHAHILVRFMAIRRKRS